ncbi:DegV family protein [Pediococcus claussenii]|uniref:EDD, DegV family domain protein n=1 Tax=Pediococcus claussenii (strain ATCC BAA-344 / DSM 14800 / JCM 18046 / KCTC 3811 / LMG 21948 / P06) TaxID=701521 RepID=G8PF13_PEDCP|nr:DegV family protein [Pediococcus claussenii]AEV95692.1 EDD, DegV family domain protein [Pediococcus claussenii ATCC BAA-344]ANZ69203.1 fatty acid-binding protein DegV [Pediococcus claussenii]ANZ71020.1 fatty acid-binding protein DegV [Pediococcus claussenii]KRN20075.1 hypothetical protein IV79_GL000739 [Pediococcus claussenii]
MNPSKIAVVVDSSANLDPAIVRKHSIVVVNQPVMFGNRVYHENVDLDTAEFFRMLKSEKSHPVASQVSMHEMQGVFLNLAQQGYEGVLCVGISGGISGFINSVAATVPSIHDLQVFPFDSRSISVGTGNLAVKAAQLLQDGMDIHTVLDKLREIRENTYAYVAVNNIKELQNTGNIANRTSLIESFLGMRPILHVNANGRLEIVEKERQMSNAMEAIENILVGQVADYESNWLVTVIDANDLDRNVQWQGRLKELFPQLQIETGTIGPYIGTFTGNHAVGLVWSKIV